MNPLKSEYMVSAMSYPEVISKLQKQVAQVSISFITIRQHPSLLALNGHLGGGEFLELTDGGRASLGCVHGRGILV